MAVEAVAPETTGSKRPIIAWALYDLANTIYSLNIVSLYFSLWVVNDMGGRDGDYGLANSLSMALVLVSAPLLGAISDHTPRRMPFLIVTTLLCCAFTFTLGSAGLVVSLWLFVAANYCYQSGLIFYDAMLPTVSTEANRGKVSGLGVGLGYFGSLIGLGVGMAVLALDPAGKPTIFKLTAVLFLFFAIPCFVWVKERPRPAAVSLGAVAVRRAIADLRATVARAHRYPELTRFLTGRIFYTDAANTIIAFMSIYVTREVGFTETEAQVVLLIGIIFAAVSGLAWGVVVDRIEPRRTLDLVLAVWAIVFLLVIGIAYAGLPRPIFWIVAVLAGIALGGTWTADRPLMLRLTPPRHLGQFYGLYSMAGRFSAITGPLIWTAIVDWLGWGRPAAVGSLLVMIAVSFVVLRPVHGKERVWTDDELVRT